MEPSGYTATPRIIPKEKYPPIYLSGARAQRLIESQAPKVLHLGFVLPNIRLYVVSLGPKYPSISYIW